MADTFVNPGFTDTGMIGGRTYLTPGEKDELTGLADLARGLISQPVNTPQQQLAGFSPVQMLAFQNALQGIGGYQPYLTMADIYTSGAAGGLQGALGETQRLAGLIPGQITPGQRALQEASGKVDVAAERARASTAEAQRALQEASAFGLESARSGIAGLAPSAALEYMSPYEDAAVQQALQDIARQGELQQQDVRAKAVQAGAFGGSRQAVAEQELNRNILEQQGRTAAQMRAAGYESAANRALQAAQQTGQLGQIGSGAAAQAAEAGGRLGLSAEQLAQQSAQAAGDLGLQSANLGLAGIQGGLGAQQQAAGLNQGLASLGGQYLGLGQAQQQMGLQDINTLLGIGQTQQRQAQAGLDVSYQNQFQQAMQPYQQLAYYSDILGGTPSGQMSTTTQPGPSTGSQMLGLAMAVPAIYQGFQGMTS